MAVPCRWQGWSVTIHVGTSGWSYLTRDDARLGYFLSRVPARVRVAVELRHPSWDDSEVYALLERHGAAHCVMSGAPPLRGPERRDAAVLPGELDVSVPTRTWAMCEPAHGAGKAPAQTDLGCG